jgi:hypothetical protein
MPTIGPSLLLLTKVGSHPAERRRPAGPSAEPRPEPAADPAPERDLMTEALRRWVAEGGALGRRDR